MMFRNFWFYFNTLPVLFGIFSLYKLNSLPPRGNFKDALEHCKDVDNERMLSEGTEQDYCIDNFMMGNFDEGFVWTLFLIIGIVFIFPLSIYLLIKFIKPKYSRLKF